MRLATLGRICLWAVFGWSGLPSALAGDYDVGRAIYEEGRLSSGAPLVGRRFGAEVVSGEAAACITCHRRSGMGAVEGEILVAPITGISLFSTTERVVATMDPRRGKRFNPAHPPYDNAAFARALRDGIHVTGREMHALMPRYSLSDAEVAGVRAYLEQLSSKWSPGVDKQGIDFATVLAPGVKPAEKAAYLQMVEAVLRGKNSSTRPGHRYMTNPAEMMLKSGRRWNVHVWELSGAPESWEAQLKTYYQKQPVFALLSGLAGNGSWAPVDRFCEAERLPCLFPSVSAVDKAQEGHYAAYFSRGTLLEADTLAMHLKAGGEHARHVVQVHGGDFSAIMGAQRFSEAFAGEGRTVETVRLGPGDMAEQLSSAIRHMSGKAQLVMWLSGEMLAGLEGVKLPDGERVYLSTILLNDNLGLVPVQWRQSVQMVYPYELPQRRRANLAFLNAWLQLKEIPLINVPMQSEVFFTLNFVNDVISEMLNNLYRDYLIERIENMVAFREGSKAEQELRDRNLLGRSTLRGPNAQGASVKEARELLELGQAERGIGDQAGTTIYPRLSLATGQRFASKGAYIVKYRSSNSDTIKPVTDWLVP